MGSKQIIYTNWDWDEVHRNTFFCPDAAAAEQFKIYLGEIRKAGSSVGGEIEVHATGSVWTWAPV